MSPENLVKEQEGLIGPPSSVQLVVEPDYCPLHCGFCDESCSSGFPEGNVDFQTTADIFHALKKWGVRSVTFTGGEPSYYKDLIEAILLAKKLGFRTSLATNGLTTCFPPREWSILKGGIIIPNLQDRIAHILDVLKLPLHGATAETHNKICGIKGAFEAVIATLIERSRHHFDDFKAEVTCVVTRDNYPEVPGLVDICASLGVSQLTLSEVQLRGKGRGFPSLVSLEKIEELHRSLVKPPIAIVVRPASLSCVLVGLDGEVTLSHNKDSPDGILRVGNLLVDRDFARRWNNCPRRQTYHQNYRALHILEEG